MQRKTERARDLTAPINQMEWNGVMRPLVYDNNCYRIAEDVYDLHYHRPDANIYTIIQHVLAGRLGAMMAIFYGALVSGGMTRLSWDEFVKGFRLASVPALRDVLLEAVQQTLPDAGEGDGANPQTPAPETDIPGSGSTSAPSAAE